MTPSRMLKAPALVEGLALSSSAVERNSVSVLGSKVPGPRYLKEQE